MNPRLLIFVFLVPFTIFGMDQVQNEQLLNAKQLLFVKAFLNEKFQSSYQQTTLQERILLGVHGIKIPVYVYTLDENKQTNETAGCIVKDSQPITLFGMSYDEKAIPVDRVFLKTPIQETFNAQILGRIESSTAVRASCLLVKKNMTTSILAVLWVDYKDNKKLFLTLSDLGSLQWNDPIINLDKNKQHIA